MKKNNDKRLKKLNDKIDSWFEYYADNIKLYQYNVNFNEGPGQWDPDTLAYYEQNGKVALTNNLLNKYTKQIVGEQLSTTPEMQIVVDTDKSNQKTIALRQDLLHTIQIKNNSREGYEVAFDSSLKGGWGALHFYTEYESGVTFNQVIRQDPVKEPPLCFWDPKAKDKTKGDGDYAGIITFMRKSEFERKYPGFEWCGENWDTNVIDPAFFIPQMNDEDELVAIAEIYEKRYSKKKIISVSPTISGEKEDVIFKSEFDDYVAAYSESKAILNEVMGIDEVIELPQIMDERTTDDYQIKCYRLVKNQVLEEYDFPSKFLPIIYVDGYSYMCSGKQIVKSFTQDAHDAQKCLNYFYSELAQHVRTYRRETVWGTDKMFDGSMQQMRNPEKPAAYMKFNPDLAVPGGVPIFRESKPLPTELLAACDSAKQNILDILGRSEASMGDPGQEISGVAINARQTQQNTVINKYFDGLLKAIEHAGNLVNDLINNLYDQPREMMMMTEDSKSYKTKLNDFNPETNEVENEIVAEDYAIRISVGANYEIQRQAERQYILEMLNASQNPMFAKVADLLAGLSDTAIMPRMVERMKTVVDPAILAKEEGTPPPPPPPPDPRIQLEQEQLKNEMALTQVKGMQAQVDKMKAQMDLMLGYAQLEGKNLQANASLQKAVIEAGKDLNQNTLDRMGHSVQALGHIKDLATLMQPDQSSLTNSGGQSAQMAEQGGM